MPRRLRGLLIAAPCWALLIVAAVLSPSDAGTGTHRQLGLPGCSMLMQTGWPCPTCGMTTSVSAMVHGRAVLAWNAHPFGVFLFIAAVLAGGAGSVEAVSGKDVFGVLRPRWWWALALIAALAAGWGAKILTGLINGTLPMR